MPHIFLNGARLAAAIPNARLVAVANHYTILFGPSPRTPAEVHRFLSD